jgi:hypothetical protein
MVFPGVALDWGLRVNAIGLGSLILRMGHGEGLTDEEVDLFNSLRDLTPAEPWIFEDPRKQTGHETSSD